MRRNAREQRRDALVSKLDAVLQESLQSSDDDPELLAVAIGRLMSKRKTGDKFTTDDSGFKWMADAYTADIVGPLAPALLKLHRFLVNHEGTPDHPHDFEGGDRYGAAFADQNWKSMAFQTQNYTYMLVLQPSPTFSKSEEGELVSHSSWAVHIRLCTASHHSYDYARPSLNSLDFLQDYDAVYPEIGYGKKSNEYFRYKDGRDRGYLCTVEPEMVGQRFRAKDSLWGPAHSYLNGVLYDLGCHCSLLESNHP